MSSTHLFVMDPLASLNRPLDSSLRMMYELSRRGHTVYSCTPTQLSWSNTRDSADANCAVLRFSGSPMDFTEDARTVRSLRSFDALHMRKDPPYDLDYVATTWLLDTALPSARVYNAPQALRRFNEKLAIFLFPQDCHQALVSCDPAALLGFVRHEAAGDAILKPLTLFGGRGVERLQLALHGEDQIRAKLEEATQRGQSMRLIQPFDKAVFAGEVRAFTAFGKPIAWCLKRPLTGNFLANTSAGAKLEIYEPSAIEMERVTRIATTLFAEGVAFIGFDIIGGFISEVNLTSPRLLKAPHDKNDYYDQLVSLIEADLGQS